MKLIITLFLALTITSSFQVHRAQAATGAVVAATGGTAFPFIVLGSTFCLAAAYAAVTADLQIYGNKIDRKFAKIPKRDQEVKKTTNSMFKASYILLGLGIVLLNENNTGSLAFGKLDHESAKALGVDKSAREKFNRKIQPINQIGKAISKRCMGELLKTNETYLEQAVICSDLGWEKFRQLNPHLLTDEIFNVIQAIRHQAITI